MSYKSDQKKINKIISIEAKIRVYNARQRLLESMSNKVFINVR